jgi:3-phenylpropionate/trans-cinnamate dioxygenase ferredoxin component
MGFVAVAKLSDLAPGQMKGVEAGGTKLLLANVEGTVHAIAAKCPHMGADLCKGSLQGSIVTCPKHKAGFDVRDGSAVDPAKVLFLKMKTKDVQSFAAKIDNDEILVEI